MFKWIADTIISGVDGFDNPINYSKVMDSFKTRFPDKMENIKYEVDRILVNKGYEFLIDKNYKI